MEDLREVGMKAIESVANLGALVAGDLTLGIMAVVEELQRESEVHQGKLKHLERLFSKFAMGQEYAGHEERKEESDTLTLSGLFFAGNPPLLGSGIPSIIPPSSYVIASGTCI